MFHLLKSPTLADTDQNQAISRHLSRALRHQWITNQRLSESDMPNIDVNVLSLDEALDTLNLSLLFQPHSLLQWSTTQHFQPDSTFLFQPYWTTPHSVYKAPE